jgi:RNA polymerase sigma-70 factor (ECF subfamily)
MNRSAKFEFLYRQYYGPVYKFCFRFLQSRDRAQDTVQETFIKLYERMNNKGNDIENTRAWLYKVASNLCMNSLDSTKRHSEIENLLDSKSVETSTPEHIFIEDERRMLVQMAIGQLKPENQMLILMYQDGLSYREISEATGIKFNSVGKTLWRAIDKLSANINF